MRRCRSGPTAACSSCAGWPPCCSNCSPERYAVNKERMMRVAEYSRDCLRELRAETGIAATSTARSGTLQLFRTQAQLDAVQRDVAVLQECGVPFQLLDRSELATVEPALARTRRSAGRRPAPAERRDRRLPPVHARPGRDRARARRRLPLRPGRRRPAHRGRPHRRRAPGRPGARSAQGRPLRARLRQLLARLRGTAGPRHPGVPGQGLLADRAADRSVRWRRSPPCSTRPTRSPSRASTTASASAAWPSSAASTCA